MSDRLSELVQVRVSTEPRCLEELLDCLANLSFPINPQIYHGVPTIVEFPAYESGLDQVRSALHAYNFDVRSLTAILGPSNVVIDRAARLR